MDKRKKSQILNTKNTDDFNTMRGMLTDIEIKIMQLDPLHQFEFYQSLQTFILFAWEDACNPENEFLYKQEWKNN